MTVVFAWVVALVVTLVVAAMIAVVAENVTGDKEKPSRLAATGWVAFWVVVVALHVGRWVLEVVG